MIMTVITPCEWRSSAKMNVVNDTLVTDNRHGMSYGEIDRLVSQGKTDIDISSGKGGGGFKSMGVVRKKCQGMSERKIRQDYA